VCEPFAVPAGSVTLTLALPSAATGVGAIEPVSSVPLEGSSSRNVTVWPGTKLERLPVSVAGSVETLAGASVRLGAATVTALLCALSLPVQLPWTGVTV
jgi:hypothetical protein